MSEIIDTELHLVAIFGQCWWGGHDAGITDQDVKASRGEGFVSHFDGVEGGQVDFDKGDVNVLGGRLNRRDKVIGACFVATCKVDFGRIVFCKGEYCRRSDACGSWADCET